MYRLRYSFTALWSDSLFATATITPAMIRDSLLGHHNHEQ